MRSAIALLPAFWALAAAQGSSTMTTATTTATYSSPFSSGGPDALDGPCFPRLVNGTLDRTTPCGAVLEKSFKCLSYNGKNGTSDQTLDPAEKMMKRLAARSDNDTRDMLDQQCICQADTPGAGYFDDLAGCAECLRLHGLRKDWFPAQLVPEASSSYCALSSPTMELGGFLKQFVATATTPSLGTNTPTDVLGTSTAVSLYFTSSSAAAAATTTGASSSAPNSTSTSASAAGAPAITAPPVVGAMVAGMLGLVALL